jgi:hypothetical protein
MEEYYDKTINSLKANIPQSIPFLNKVTKREAWDYHSGKAFFKA